jgi:hypothetical protein
VESYNTVQLVFTHQHLAKEVINFVGNLNSMEIKRKIDNLLKQREEIDKQISLLEYELVQKEHAKFIQLVGQYVKKCTDTCTIIMYVRKARLFGGHYQLFGPSIQNYSSNDYTLSTRFYTCVESNLSNIEIVSKDEWDNYLHKIKEIVDYNR